MMNENDNTKYEFVDNRNINKKEICNNENVDKTEKKKVKRRTPEERTVYLLNQMQNIENSKENIKTQVQAQLGKIFKKEIDYIRDLEIKIITLTDIEKINTLQEKLPKLLNEIEQLFKYDTNK